MKNKLQYKNGTITTFLQTFNCSDDTDMTILCNNVNALLLENEIKIQKMETQLMLIEQALKLNGKIE